MTEKQNIALAGAATRRDFLKKTATAAAAVAATGFLKTPVYGQATAPSANVAGANSKLTLGFVGLGNQGMNSHFKPILAAAGEYNLAIVAACDVSKHRVEEAVAAVPGAKGYEDYRQLLERKDIDVVFCATVDHWHGKVSLDAINAGKHVYVEKPMTRYLGEAFELYDAVKKSGKILQVGSQGCSDLKWHKAAEWIKAGKIGPVVMCQGSYMRNTPKGEWNYTIQPWATKDDINWNLWVGDKIKAKKDFSPDDYFRWRKYYRYCAGLLGDLFPHKLHPYMLATGNPEFPKRVAAVGSKPCQTDKNTPGTPERDSPEILQLIAEFPSGVTMHICSSSVNEQGVLEMIRGNKASLTMGGNKVELKPERPFAEEIEPENSEQFPPESIPVHHKNFFDCIRANKQPNCSVDLATRVQAVVSLGEMSERLGVVCFFDEKTRKITTSDGKELQPLTYGSVEGLS
ncbi:MAG: Gfo/Idh/MocA family oxidoreductase [Verrucomicrobia bacterium]|nr:Gfo/Idh/MocA family oxidoreductase [Verrucomicrobiota bacterium]